MLGGIEEDNDKTFNQGWKLTKQECGSLESWESGISLRFGLSDLKQLLFYYLFLFFSYEGLGT